MSDFAFPQTRHLTRRELLRTLGLGGASLSLMPPPASAAVQPGSGSVLPGDRETTDFVFNPIYRAPQGRSAMYAQLTPLSDGSLLCAFRDARIDETGVFGAKGSPWTVPGSRIVCIRSSDGGRTWTDSPVPIYEDKDSSCYTSQGGQGYQTADGTILVPFYAVSLVGGEGKPLHIHWNFLAASRDGGRTWWCRNLPSAPFLTNPAYGGIHQVRQGTLWMVERCRGFKITLDQAYLEKRSWLEVRSCVRIMESKDDGETWRPFSYVGYDPTRPVETGHFPEKFKEDEPALVRLPSGRILLIARPHLYQAISDDDGRTWSIKPTRFTQAAGAFSGLCPVLLHSKSGPAAGTLLLAYHDRWGAHASKGGVYLAFSHDDGLTWGHPTYLDSGAYPCLLESRSEAGRLLCAYYHSSTLLKVAHFKIPFPTGLRTTLAKGRSGALEVVVEWDEYRGEKSDSYQYGVLRAETADTPLSGMPVLATLRDSCRLVDSEVKPGRAYFYRIVVRANGRIIGSSWQAECAVHESKLP